PGLPVRKLAAEIFARAEDSGSGSVTRISPSRRSKPPRTGPRPNRCRVVNVMAERTRIAREMHDVLAHRLSLLATYAGAIEYRPDAPPEQVARAAGVVRAGAHQALDELREVITVLREDDGDGDA